MYEEEPHLELIKKEEFEGKILMLGYGIVNKGLTPVLEYELEDFDVSDRVKIITKDDRNKNVAKEYGITHIVKKITEENVEEIIFDNIDAGDIVVNMTAGVDSLPITLEVSRNMAHSIQSSNETWERNYGELPEGTPHREKLYARSNLFERKRWFEAKKQYNLNEGTPTQIACLGANPGWVEFLFPIVIQDICKKHKLPIPQTQEEVTQACIKLQVQTVMIAERDNQKSRIYKKDNEMVNTWSPTGFMEEGSQMSELSLGTHEKKKPKLSELYDNELYKNRVLIMNSTGLQTKVKFWLPIFGQTQGYLITHNESIALAERYSTKDFAFTCGYFYKCGDLAQLTADQYVANDYENKDILERQMLEDIAEGMDLLGISVHYMYENKPKVHFKGSSLNIHEARNICPCNSATSLQVVAGVMSGIKEIVRNPMRGMIEPVDIDFKKGWEDVRPYLGNIISENTDWTPLQNIKNINTPSVDWENPFALQNFIISPMDWENI